MSYTLEANSAVKIHPRGLYRDVKDNILELIPEEDRARARAMLRTGEENAVIFAKVSRSSAGFDEISQGVDEEGAAKFHQKWTVDVEGYGHKSVGEHATIQIDVENVSSLDGDEITDNRLGSYTEFSARFKGRQSVSYYTPRVVLEDPRLSQLWNERHQALFAATDNLTTKGKEWVFTQEAQDAFKELHLGYVLDKNGDPESLGAWRARLGKHAADQFKNMLPASRSTSIGVTMNATEMEGAITKLLSSPQESTREVGEMMKAAALEVAPTLVKYAESNPYIASLPEKRRKIIAEFNLQAVIGKLDSHRDIKPDITDLIDLESHILAAFLYESADTGSFYKLLTTIEALDRDKKAAMYKVLTEGLSRHDMPPRAYEFQNDQTIEWLNMIYGDWREYKRHRMQSYAAKPLNIKWGYYMPPLAGLMDQSQDSKFHSSEETIKNAVDEMEELYKEIFKVDPLAAEFAVTRLHYRPAIAQFNPREAYHLLKLRTGDSAHPFIRRLMWPVVDIFTDLYPNVFGALQLRGNRTEIAFP